ncbi:MAG: hypothetical protein BWK76_18915 [Desulfobulbaceae bacterium A2]|nr:MAG: hypothetical protein BWK76_18915 [Desulfobulbaceae bacterium A2]
MKKLVLVAVWWVGVTFITLVVVEYCLRVFAPLRMTGGYIGAYQYDSELGYRLKEGYWTVTTDYKQEVQVNRMGSVNAQTDFSQYRFLVFSLGDSYTQGTGLPLDGSYPAQLDLLLNMDNGRYGRRYGVVNLGLAAYGGEQSLIVYQRFKELVGVPRFILYFGCDNDAEDDDLFKAGYKHQYLVEGNPRYGMWQRPLAWLIHDTELGKRANYIRGMRVRGKAARMRGEEKGPVAQAPSVAQRQERHLVWLKNEAFNIGATLIVSWANDPNYSRSYSWMHQWALENGVAFADWYPAVESVLAAMPLLPLANDHSGGHYRIWVNSLITAEFGRHVISAGTRQPGESTPTP